MTQPISVKCKLIVLPDFRGEIDRTMEGFADACNQILEVAKRENCWNTTKLHHLVYKPVRETTGLKANHVCQAIRRVIGNAKAVKQIHKFRPTSISLDVRTFIYKEETQSVGVTLMCGRVEFKLSIGGYQIALLRGQTPTSATLNKTKLGDYNINFVVDIPTQPTGKTPKVIGVDLGRRDIATTSTGDSWSGKQIQSVRDRYTKVRANIQSKRTRSSRRLLRRLSGRERRFQEWLNHNISKQLVQKSQILFASLAFEDLTNIRQSLNTKPRSKIERRRTNNWAFYQLRLFVGYKANIAGVRVIFVPPAYTSQTCSRCGHIHPVKGKSYRNGKVFKCGHCGFEHDADINAAKNIAALGLSVSQPESPGLTCQLQGQMSM
ncbi:MAG: transposase [Nostoc sp.]|uniref:RNA-guided endonuclease InsQ/TnpB family protein n=1 Tax=Nostoc sp. TaxID=1180 RepID=UPI002FF85607